MYCALIEINISNREVMIAPKMASRTMELETPGRGHSTGEGQEWAKASGGKFPRGRWLGHLGVVQARRREGRSPKANSGNFYRTRMLRNPL